MGGMKDDPLRKRLLAELRALRRSPGSLSVEQIAGSPTLVEVAGNGSVEQAYTTMLDVLDQQTFLKESDVVTYFATCGHGASGTTLEARLNDQAARFFIDPRTVLRRSNRGAEKLSYIFRDMSVFNRPLGKINLVQKENELACQIIIRFPKYSQYRKPDVYVDGKKHDGMAWVLVDDPEDASWFTAKETLFDLPLRIPLIGFGHPARQHRTIRLQPLPDSFQAELLQAAERRQVRTSEGSVRHVEVFQMGGVRTPIIGRPRPLPRDRHATPDYTLNCDEPGCRRWRR